MAEKKWLLVDADYADDARTELFERTGFERVVRALTPQPEGDAHVIDGTVRAALDEFARCNDADGKCSFCGGMPKHFDASPVRLAAERDALRAEARRLREERDHYRENEIPQLRAEVERLKAEVEALTHEDARYFENRWSEAQEAELARLRAALNGAVSEVTEAIARKLQYRDPDPEDLDTYLSDAVGFLRAAARALGISEEE